VGKGYFFTPIGDTALLFEKIINLKAKKNYPYRSSVIGPFNGIGHLKKFVIGEEIVRAFT
jgi:hypothetical protein